MSRSICVFCSSSNYVDSDYFAAAEELGTEIGRNGDRLVYGGGTVGLMGAVARAADAHDAHIIGVIPDFLTEKEMVGRALVDDLVVTTAMYERKSTMYQHADSFIVLPGGFGTLEELTEVLSLKKLKRHQKPLILLNINGFFDPLLAYFDQLVDEGFSGSDVWDLFYVTTSPAEAVRLVDGEAAA